jgi:2-methylcitrate dehydratase PrpD
LGLDEFDPGVHADPAVRAMMAKTEAIVHPDLAGADSKVVCSAGIVEIETVSSKRLAEHVPAARGSAENPVEADVLEDKFRMCAGRALGKPQAERALDLALRIDRLPSVRTSSMHSSQPKPRGK